VFIKNLNSTFSPKFRVLRHLGEMSEGQRGLTERLRQQTLKQPLHLPRGLAHPPPHEVPERSERERLDPRHHARKDRYS
jgi:hypothetical protein